MTTARMSAGGYKGSDTLAYMAGALLSAVLAYFALQAVVQLAGQEHCTTSVSRVLNDDGTISTVTRSNCA